MILDRNPQCCKVLRTKDTSIAGRPSWMSSQVPLPTPRWLGDWLRFQPDVWPCGWKEGRHPEFCRAAPGS